MKLKNLLVLAFSALTLIPIVIACLLLYKSGFNLSRESYIHNLIESITIQEDYISQTIENNMILEHRFVNRISAMLSEQGNVSTVRKENILTLFQSYLETSEDKFTVCLLLDKNNVPIYTIGENSMLEIVLSQLPDMSQRKGQSIDEFELEDNTYTIGITTPIRNDGGIYIGSFVSLYNKYYLFKIISSYYKIANTSTYICRKNGEIVKFRKFSDTKEEILIERTLKESITSSTGLIDKHIGSSAVLGYYKSIHKAPWYISGFINESLIYAFVDQFVWVYMIIIGGVLLAGIILSFYFSQKVVEPINDLIQVMDRYQNGLEKDVVQTDETRSYFEIQYLRTKFSDLMKKIMLVQHNFEGIYHLYQSNSMGDINIDIDAKQQTIASNKEIFQTLMNELNITKDACIVERFVRCFCEKDQKKLMQLFENMRDEHLSVACEAEVYTPHLNQKWFHALVVPMYEDDRLSRLFVQLRDISNFKRHEFETIEQARRDPLTKLYNRAGFADHVKRILQNENDSESHGLLFIDMDSFKLVNDNLGHSTGDDLLCSASEVIVNTVGSKGISSRLGGDEFAIFLPDASEKEVYEIKETLNKRLVYPFHTEALSFVVSASIGISLWSRVSPKNLEELLNEADINMYHEKKSATKMQTRALYLRT